MTTTYKIDPSHAHADFSVKHMMISKVKGGFEKISGTFLYDSNDIARSSVNVKIEVESIYTGEAQRDAHLKSADFFDQKKYPQIEFRSTRFYKNGEHIHVVGDLTIHGVTRPVELAVDELTDEVKDPWGNRKRGVSATTKIKRKDFGLTWNAALETGGVLVGDDVAITINAELNAE
jgi:polyisoprenoid-binding protein YceI